ncbi:S9 family peptidase [Sphaerisporangium sp. NPDC051017]|uniref:S9 family peptidase n=1 Tax=Sphaerisporangium sp. NPDC051017 TaxID=3154636 RepID=UPI0034466810
MPTRPFQLDDLYAIHIPSDPQMSPDGRSVAFVVSVADAEKDHTRSTIWLVTTDGGEPKQLTSGPADSAPRFSPDGRHLLYLSSSDGGPAQLWSLPLDGGEATRLTDLPLGADLGVWSPDGTMIAWTATVDGAETVEDSVAARRCPVVVDDIGYKIDGLGLRKELRQQLFVLTVDGGQARQLTDGDHDHTMPVWAPDSRGIAVSMPDYSVYGTVLCPQTIAVVDVETGRLTPVTAADAMFWALDWSPDGETLLMVGSDRAGLAEPRLWTVPAEGGQAPRQLLPDHPGNHMPNWDLTFPARFTADGTRVRFGEWYLARTRVLEAPVTGGAPKELLGGTRTVRTAAYGTEAIAFVAGDEGHIAELYISDGQGERQLTRFQESNLGEVDFVAPQVRVFEAPDGQRVHGYILRKDDVEGPSPLLVDVHGGPYNAWTPALSEHFLYQQALAGQGWTVLCVDSRGSASYGDAFMQATNGDWHYADEGDILGAVDVVVAEGLADPARLVLSGFSYGGTMTAWLTTRTDRFAAAIAGVMISDHVSWQGTDAGVLTSEWIAGGPLREVYDRLTDRSPIAHVGKVTTPFMILQNEEDLRCPMLQGELWFQALRAQGVRARLVRYPEVTHFALLGGGAPSYPRDAYQRLMDWALEHTAAASDSSDTER